VWGDRYHRRDLTSARQVRNAILYCLANYKKHQGVTDGMPRIDPCSSARWFQGWTAIRTHDDGPRPSAGSRSRHTTLWREASASSPSDEGEISRRSVGHRERPPAST
jgi:hypothetical protein